MARKGNPRKRGPRRAYWCYDDVADGRERRGWVASDLYVIGCHRTNAHRPCEHEFPELRRKCAGCAKGLDVVDMGYLAVFRDDGYPMLLVLHEHTHEEVEKLSFGARIKWSRRGGVGEPVAVYPRLEGPAWTSTLPERQRPADLVPFLAHLWGMDGLEPHIRAYFASSDNGVSLDQVDTIPEAPHAKRSGGRTKAEGEFRLTTGERPGEAVKRFVAGLPAPPRPISNGNGKH